jgi:selenocysteine-specific elongation factor
MVSRAVVAAAAEAVAARIADHHAAHPLEPGMSLEALRAGLRDPVGVPPAEPVAALVLDLGVRKRLYEVSGSVARRPDWAPAADPGAGALLQRRLTEARWEIPTVAELEREFPGLPVQGLVLHLARLGGVEQVDRERFGSPAALNEFRTALEGALRDLQSATASQLRERFGLTRKYLIPLLEWADRRGITRRVGDARVLVRLTAGSGGS